MPSNFDFHTDDDASDIMQIFQLEAQLSFAAGHVDDGRRPELLDDEPPENADAARLREGRLREGAGDLCGNQPVRRGLSAMTRPSWLGRAVRNRHRHAIEQGLR